MLVSHQHKFIFVRCRKTASTSTEIHLSKWVGPRDIVTSFCERDELLRLEEGGVPPQNQKHGDLEFFNHMPAQALAAALPKEWAKYFKFCFERNPWDKVISLYFHRHKKTPRISFDEFLASNEALDARNYPLYTIEGRVAVDRVARYENLLVELCEICEMLGIPRPTSLASAKSQFRQDRRHYREFLSSDHRAYIDRAFADEIELHRYRF